MSVSDEFEWDQLHALHLLELADEIGRPRSWAQRRLERLLDHLAKALPQAAVAVIPQQDRRRSPLPSGGGGMRPKPWKATGSCRGSFRASLEK